MKDSGIKLSMLSASASAKWKNLFRDQYFHLYTLTFLNNNLYRIDFKVLNADIYDAIWEYFIVVERACNLFNH